MRIRTDFVTNSSSTSFVLISQDEFSEGVLLDLMGIAHDSPLAGVFAILYTHMCDSIEELSTFLLRKGHADLPLVEALKGEFPPQVIERIVAGKSSGSRIYIGSLSSDDGDQIEAFFCMDSFEEENEKVYLNALDCAW